MLQRKNIYCCDTRAHCSSTMQINHGLGCRLLRRLKELYLVIVIKCISVFGISLSYIYTWFSTLCSRYMNVMNTVSCIVIYITIFCNCRVPEITIATDVICGFPTETEEVSTHTFLTNYVQMFTKYNI